MRTTIVARPLKYPSKFLFQRSFANSSAKKIVIIGGVAGGATAAARLRRLSEKCDITLIEQGNFVSFANCGLPYHISGEIKDRNKLLLQTPESLKETINIQNILTATQAIHIDRSNKKVKVVNVKTRSSSDIAYDKLILSMGASPLSPSTLPGAQQCIDQGKVVTLRTIPDMDHINEMIQQGAKSAVVVGAGYIGLEMVEALVARGLSVTLVEKQNHILPIMDEEMTWQILAQLHSKGVTVKTGEGVKAFESSPGKLGVKLTLESGSGLQGDFVLCCTGVNPDSKLASEAGLATNSRGAVIVNDYQQTSDKDVYAVGDCVETADPILGQRVWVPLGGPANRQGRVAADHIMLGSSAQKYPGTLGTAIVRVFDCAAGVTGYTETKLTKMGFKPNQDFLTTTVSATQHASYFPGALPLSLKLIWRKSDGKILGGQAVGMEGVDKRIDVISMVLRSGMTVDDLVHAELSYAPPFGSAKDIVNLAAFCAQNMQQGLLKPTYSLPKEKSQGVTLDVRPTEVAQIHALPNSVNIPFSQIRQRIGELAPYKNSSITTICGTGKTSYFAARTLNENGFNTQGFIGGAAVLEPPAMPAVTNSTTSNVTLAASEEHHLDACGLSCPGPIIAIRKCMDTMPEGKVVKVTATDPGFANDLPAFCKMTGISMLGINRDKGVITARIVKGTPATAPSPAKAATPASTERRGTSIIVFSQEWDKVLAAFVLATGSAATGAPVTMFFTFWGLNVLRKPKSSSPPSDKAGVPEKAFQHLMPKGPGHLPLSHFNMGGIGQWMFKKVMHEKHLPDVEGLMKEAKSMGVRMVACNMSMDALGLARGDLIEECELGGVADFLAASSTSATSLFI